VTGVVDPFAVGGKDVKDLVGGFMPDEWFGVVVPVGDPVADRPDQFPDGALGGALDSFDGSPP
jgi:hypothetical protein